MQDRLALGVPKDGANWSWYVLRLVASGVRSDQCKLVEKIVKHDSWPIQPDILNHPLLQLTSRKLLWLDLQPIDIKSRWRHNWKSAQVANSHLVCDPTIRQPGFDLHRQQWFLLNRFRMEQGHCGACRRKWWLILICVLVARPRRCPTLSNPVPWQNWMAAYFSYTLQTADEDVVSWLTNNGSWHAYEKKCISDVIS